MMENTSDTLLTLLDPQPGSTIMVYDVHASESGALAILDDLYEQIKSYPDKSIRWVFIVSTPEYQETDNIIVRRYPWVKEGWHKRYYFNKVTTKKILKEFMPDQVFSLQNEGIAGYKKKQTVYLHLPFILTDHRFRMKEDGKRLWLYQNIVSKMIFKSLRKVDMTIVQTRWMKQALIEKARVSPSKIKVLQPDVSMNCIGHYADNKENRKHFFYPATAFTYKNHITLLKALHYAQEHGLENYRLDLTIEKNENGLTRFLADYAEQNHLQVVFGGKMPRQNVFEMYTKSVLLFPSYVESFGLPLLEAKLTGCYIIASDCPFTHDILDGYDKAFLFSETDFEAMGKLILELENV